MSSYDPPGSQWVRPRTLVEQWVASWAPSEAQHRAAWMAEAAKQSQRAALKRQELGHIRRGENDTVFYSAGSQGRKDSYIEKLFKQRAEAKKDEQPAEADE